MIDCQIFKRIGLRGGGYLKPPGNTVEAVYAGLSAGCDMVELDVRVTRDEVLVLEHNAFRVSKSHDVPIKDLSFAEWRCVAEDEDSQDPPLEALEDALHAATRRSSGVLLDLKEPGMERNVARLIRKVGVDPRTVMIAVLSDASKVVLRSLDPRLPIAHKIDITETGAFTPKLVDTINADAVFWPSKLITKERVAKLALKKIFVYAGPANGTEEMRRLRNECGVAGIATDFPDILCTI